MKVDVLLFAHLREHAGTDRLTVEFEDQSIRLSSLRKRLCEMFPSISPQIMSASLALNMEYALDSDTASDGDTVALIPPVSGGSCLLK